MKTRRSRKSFELPPPKKKRNRKSNRNRLSNAKPLNTVNETIVILSDSEADPDPEVIPIIPRIQRQSNSNDDDILVIDVADDSQEIENVEEISSDTVKVENQPPEPKTQSPRTTSPSCEPPVIDILDDDSISVPNDDCEIEFVGMVVSGPNSSKRKQSSGALRKSNGTWHGQIVQQCIKKAKQQMRRSSVANSNSWNNLSAFPESRLGRDRDLNSVATNSKGITRNKKKKSKEKFRNPNFNVGDYPNWNRNALNRNRNRENARQIIFRPDGVGMSISAPNNPPVARRDELAARIPKRFRGNPGPPAIPVGSNIMVANDASSNRVPGSLRPIVIDGSNVAIGHGDVLFGSGGRRFSPRGIQICVDYFRKRGHREIIAFVPRYRQKQNQSCDPKLLGALERDGSVRFTPSREAGPHRIASYDDMFVIQYAHETGGIIISNDNFRDIYGTNPQLQETITMRQMMFTWVTPDVIMFPQDPLGPGGPTLDNFLMF